MAKPSIPAKRKRSPSLSSAMNCHPNRFWWSTTASPCIDTNGQSDHCPRATASNSSASSRVAENKLFCAFHHDAHAVGLDDSDWRLWRDEFAFGDNIDYVIGETRFAARPQNGDRNALHPGGKSERSRELPRRTGERRAGRVRIDQGKSPVKARARPVAREERDEDE